MVIKMKGFQISALVIFSLVFFFLGVVTALSSDVKLEAGCIVTKFNQLDEALHQCNIIILDNLTVPAGKTLDLVLRDGTRLYFRGNTTFEYAVWAGPLVAINGTNVTIIGEPGAIFDGRGQLYWDGQGEWGTLKPKFVTIQLHNSTMRDIYVLNTPVHCAQLADSTNSQLLNWTINDLAGDPQNAPEKYGHNTDGFDVWNSTNVVLKDVRIFNQDDCVALRCGANILVDNFYCHGGHGLSLSVGFSNDSVELNTLQNVTISNSVLDGGDNGIHLKTHVDAGNGLMKNITYENIEIRNPLKYGINIQQNYRNLPANSSFPSEPENNIPIKNLNLKNIHGNVTSSAVPVFILCADEGCFDWNFTDVTVDGIGSNDCNFVPKNFTC